jgi:hypothetical protein
MKQVDRFLLVISLLACKRFRAFNKLHVHRHFHLQHIHPVAVFGELAHALGDDLRFFLRVVQSFFVRPVVITHEL